MVSRYFKLVCLSKDPEWIIGEFRNGRVRFGWSPPGTDLRKIRHENRHAMSEQEQLSWKQAQFLIERIGVGDRVVVQPEQPLQSFLIGEVMEPGYEFMPGTLNDFNHVLHIRPFTAAPIPVNVQEVTVSLKHDLSKRGRYYQIYPEDSLKKLDDLVARSEDGELDLGTERVEEDIHDLALGRVKEAIIQEISQSWRAKDFEKLCEDLCNSLDHIEVKERKDSGKGWDMLVRVINPITGSILADEVPAQCKNFTGPVHTTKPIDDLQRGIEETRNKLALLFILGELTDDFRYALQTRQERLSREMERDITFEIVDQNRIAELYMQYVDYTLQKTSSAI